MADDAGIAEQPLDLGLVEIGDLVEIETGESRAEILALAQDGQPGQAGLEAFEADLFEQPPIVGDRAAPFVVVIAAVERIAAVPGAAQPAVLALAQAGPLLRHVHLPPARSRI